MTIQFLQITVKIAGCSKPFTAFGGKDSCYPGEDELASILWLRMKALNGFVSQSVTYELVVIEYAELLWCEIMHSWRAGYHKYFVKSLEAVANNNSVSSHKRLAAQREGTFVNVV